MISLAHLVVIKFGYLLSGSIGPFFVDKFLKILDQDKSLPLIHLLIRDTFNLNFPELARGNLDPQKRALLGSSYYPLNYTNSIRIDSLLGSKVDFGQTVLYLLFKVELITLSQEKVSFETDLIKNSQILGGIESTAIFNTSLFDLFRSRDFLAGLIIPWILKEPQLI